MDTRLFPKLPSSKHITDLHPLARAVKNGGRCAAFEQTIDASRIPGGEAAPPPARWRRLWRVILDTGHFPAWPSYGTEGGAAMAIVTVESEVSFGFEQRARLTRTVWRIASRRGGR